MSDTPIWPRGLVGYKRTAEFTETTIPAALLRDHATKDGVWARLHILNGSLHFIDQVGNWETTLPIGVHEVIFPGRLHRVAPTETVRFFVEFCRLETGGLDADVNAGPALPHR